MRMLPPGNSISQQAPNSIAAAGLPPIQRSARAPWSAAQFRLAVGAGGLTARSWRNRVPSASVPVVTKQALPFGRCQRTTTGAESGSGVTAELLAWHAVSSLNRSGAEAEVPGGGLATVGGTPVGLGTEGPDVAVAVAAGVDAGVTRAGTAREEQPAAVHAATPISSATFSTDARAAALFLTWSTPQSRLLSLDARRFAAVPL